MHEELHIGYTAPELLSGKFLPGPWTDIYSLGATLYMALTGFTPPSARDRIDKDTLKPLSVCVPEIPKKLTKIVHKALALKPEARFHTAEEMQQALMEVLQAESGQYSQIISGKLHQGTKAIKSVLLRQSKKVHR